MRSKYHGDGLMTYFGWPQAREDDADHGIKLPLV